LSLARLSSTSPKRLLLLAAILHITLAIAVTIIGKTQLLPNTFDSNGVGVSFAIDSASYRAQALKMADLIDQGRFRDWLDYRKQLAPFHVRLYSLCYVTFGKVLGSGVLGVEPLNLLYYLSIVVLTYLLGAVALSPEVGRIAAMIVGLWPSLLLFSTQLLKDHLFILSFLLLMLCLVACINRSLSTRQAVGCAVAGSAALLIILLARSTMWEIVLFALLVGSLLCGLAQLRERKFELQKTIALLVLVGAAFLLPKALPDMRIGDRFRRTAARAVQENETPPASGLAAQIAWTRNKFVAGYRSAGSNVDTDVQLNVTSDLILYLPRAAEIGFLAPFPRMWVARGIQVGLAGRLFSGAEMLVMYALLVLVCITLFYERKRLSVWFLFAVSAAACVALGYVVVNVSALYRMRYVYFIMLIILAAHGFQIIRRLRERPPVT